jgi:hypothetical protein
MFFVLKFELILIIGSNNVLTEGVRKVYRGRRVGRGWSRVHNVTIHELLYVRYDSRLPLRPWVTPDVVNIHIRTIGAQCKSLSMKE